jgi:hypothetical protein
MTFLEYSFDRRSNNGEFSIHVHCSQGGPQD